MKRHHAVQPVPAEKLRWNFRNNWSLYVMLLFPLAFFAVFRYAPMSNIVIAFKDYNVFRGVWESPWVGLDFFRQAFADADFRNAVRNTFLLNGLDLLVGFPFPIFLAILLNELAFKRYKRATQTILYLPHFLSWIIISGIAMQIFAPTTGTVNHMLQRLGFDVVPFLTSPVHWVVTYVLLGLW